VKGYLSDQVKAFIREAPMCVLATSGADGRCDASPKGGKPGFVKVLGDTRLLVPDVAGNKLFQSYINISENPHAGLVFVIPGARETVRVNGTAKIVGKEELDRLEIELEVQNPDENAKVLQGLLIEVEEAYSHCPRALAFADFWNGERIEANSRLPRRV
jgi:predicted pyridoxine 5'-phosphate oxidase superfamily flavin-nucleotide-binding protein